MFHRMERIPGVYITLTYEGGGLHSCSAVNILVYFILTVMIING